jgi:hypothetical protein
MENLRTRISGLGSRMRSIQPPVQPAASPRLTPSGQPCLPNPWTGWPPGPAQSLPGLGGFLDDGSSCLSVNLRAARAAWRSRVRDAATYASDACWVYP